MGENRNMRRLVILAALALGIAWPAWAYQSAQGLCALPNQVVKTSGVDSRTKVLATYPSCTVTVYPAGSATPVPTNQVYSNSTGTVLGNPFTGTVDGRWQFWAAYGTYDITISGGGMPTPRTFSSVVISDISYAVTPQDYGAGGEGTTDDTVAIQACIDDSIAAKLVCQFPGGIYRHTGLHILNSGTTLSGMTSLGYGAPALRYEGTGAGLTIGDGTHFIYGINLYNIGVQAKDGVHGSIGIDCRGLSGGDWQGVTVGGGSTTGYFDKSIRFIDSGILNIRRLVVSNRQGVHGSTGIYFAPIGALSAGNAHIAIDGGDIFYQDTIYDLKSCNNCVFGNIWHEAFDYAVNVDADVDTASGTLALSTVTFSDNTFSASIPGDFANRKILRVNSSAGNILLVPNLNFTANKYQLVAGVTYPIVSTLPGTGAGSGVFVNVDKGVFTGADGALISSDNGVAAHFFIDGYTSVLNAAGTATSYAAGAGAYGVQVSHPVTVSGVNLFPLLIPSYDGSLRLPGSSSNTMVRPSPGWSGPGLILGQNIQAPGNSDGYVEIAAGGTASNNVACAFSGYSAVADMDRTIVCHAGSGQERLRMDAAGVHIGAGGTAITQFKTFSASLDFSAPLAVPGCDMALGVTAPGAVPAGSPVLYSPPVDVPAGMIFNAWVTANGTVAAQWCQFSGAPADPDAAGATYSVSVIH